MKKVLLTLSFVMVFGLSAIVAQTRTITGTVTGSDDGMPIPGASVFVKGTTVGTVTQIDGDFRLSVPQDAETLVISFVGMVTQEQVIAGRSVINVALVSDAIAMDEVIVTALGISRERKALGYSAQVVRAEDISRSGNTNAVNSLSGRVAGVQIVNSSGAAGASTFMTIRGVSSITGNNQPLFVVDGVPIDNSQLYSGNPDDGNNNLLSGVAQSNRSVDINPDDIESINVLKGGAATALYGLRAANGAVIITTKKGSSRDGKAVNISINSSVSIDKVSQMPEMQDKYAQGLGTYSGTSTMSWGPKISDMVYDGSADNKYDRYGNLVMRSGPNDTRMPARAYDNAGNFFDTGVSYNNSVSMSGGNQDVSYLFSVSNLSQTGIVPNNDFQRTTAMLSGDAKLTPKLRSEARISYTNSGGNRIQQGSNTSGVMLSLMRATPTFDITGGFSDPVNTPEAYMFADGTQRNAQRGGGYDNPYWTANRNPFKDEVDRITGMAGLTYDIYDWMAVSYKVGIDTYTDRRKQSFAINSRTAPTGRVFVESLFVRDFNSDLILTVNRNLTSDLAFSGLVGHNMYQSNFQRLFTQGNIMTVPDFDHISNTASTISRESVDKKRTAAFYADFGFDWRSTFYINFTGRNEWSTSLPVENNSFFFPSVSTSFVFTELPILESFPILSFGKLRGSYAIIANDAPIYLTNPSFMSASYGDGWTDGVSFPGWSTAGFQVNTRLPNPDLKPEKMTSYELGFDLRFLRNRIGMDFTYFNNKNEDLILNVPIARSSGFAAAALNAASMETKGIEVSLNLMPVMTTDVKWAIDINFTKDKNEVLELAEGVPNVFLGGFVGSQIRAVVGEPYGSIFGEAWEKDPNGNVLIVDDPSASNYGSPYMATEETNLGVVRPDWTMGVNNSINFKDVRLSFLWDFKKGGYMWNGTKGAMYYFGTHKDTETREKGQFFVWDGVKESNGEKNDIPVRLGENWYVFGEGSSFTGPAEDFIEPTDWVRLRELTLSYNFGRMLENSTIGSLEIYFTGRNLLLFTPYTGVDPETSLMGSVNAQGMDYFNMPGTKTYMFGIRMSL